MISTDGCFICGKHARGDDAAGGVLYEDALVYAGHIDTMGRPTAYRGWLIVETKRHVAGLGDLTDGEARAVGSLTNRLARLQREIAGAEHVYSFVFGHQVPHLHVHLAPRYPATPREFWGARLDEWPDAPQLTEPAMRELVVAFRLALERQLHSR